MYDPRRVTEKLKTEEINGLGTLNRPQMDKFNDLFSKNCEFEYIIHVGFLIYFKMVEAQVLKKRIKFKLQQEDID